MSERVLIVEDDSTSRELLLRLLSGIGHAVVAAVDGEDALGKLTADTELVILDLRIPKLNGFQCLEEITSKQPETPVIVVSSAGTKDAVQAMQGGAFTYLQKPYKREEILQAIESALSAKNHYLRSDRSLAALADKPLVEIENFFISWQLRKHRGNRSAAARSLGITDRTIYNKIKKYGLES